MAVGVHLPEWFWYSLGLVGFAALFAQTIKQNHKNRPLVLGVVTVSEFVGFLVLAGLTGNHAPSWLTLSVTALVVACGISILALVALDVIKWARRE